MTPKGLDSEAPIKGTPPGTPKGMGSETPIKGTPPGTPKGVVPERPRTMSGTFSAVVVPQGKPSPVVGTPPGGVGGGGVVFPGVLSFGFGGEASDSEERVVFSFLLEGVDLKEMVLTSEGVRKGEEEEGKVFKEGERLLHTAVRARCFVLLEMLLEGGEVDPKQKTKEGETVDDLAAGLFLYPSDFLFFESLRLLFSRFGFPLLHTLPRPRRGSRLPSGRDGKKGGMGKERSPPLERAGGGIPEGAPPVSPIKKRGGNNTNTTLTTITNTTDNDTDMDEITDSDFTLSSPLPATRPSPLMTPSSLPSGLPLRRPISKSGFDSPDNIFSSRTPPSPSPPGHWGSPCATHRPTSSSSFSSSKASRPSSLMEPSLKGYSQQIDNWNLEFTGVSDSDSPSLSEVCCCMWMYVDVCVWLLLR